MALDPWVRDEFSNVNLGDFRLNQRLVRVASDMLATTSGTVYSSISGAAEMKAAYRLFDNPHIEFDAILSPHFSRTIERVNQCKDIFIIQDTTSLDYTSHKKTKGLYPLQKGVKYDEPMKGMLMHTSLVLDSDFFPLGLSYLDFFGYSGNKENPGANRFKPIEEKLSFRWLSGIEAGKIMQNSGRVVHVCDREGDIFELLQKIDEQRQNFVIRSLSNRRAAKTKGETIKWRCPTLDSILKDSKSIGTMNIELEVKEGVLENVVFELKREELWLRPPPRRGESESFKLEPQNVRVLLAIGVDSNNKTWSWRILTNLPVNSAEEMKYVLTIYKKRWMIETYFKTIKTCLKVEDACLQERERLERFIVLNAILSFRLFSIVEAAKGNQGIKVTLFLEVEELSLLKKMTPLKNFKKRQTRTLTVKEIVVIIASIGGYLNRKSDLPPGLIVITRGWNRFQYATKALL